MRCFKKLTAVVLSAMFMFSTASASSKNIVDSNPNFCYKVVNEKDIVLTELKSSELQNLSDPEGYNIVEVAKDASKVEVCSLGEVISFWAAFTVIIMSPLFMFAGFMFDHPDNPPELGRIKCCNAKSKITSIDLPNCKKVGKRAFACCSRLETVNLPKCTVLEKDSFCKCWHIRKLNIPECLKLDKPFGVFNGCIGGDLQEVNAQKCTKIGKGSFKGYDHLETINIPNVTCIENECFEYCSALKSISLDSCTTIKKWAFRNCKSLENINLPNCTKIESRAFDGCCNIKKINAPKIKMISRITKTFPLCDSLEEVYIPSCKHIDAGSFSNCANLKKITISRDCKFAKNALPFERVANNKLEIVRV